MANGWLELALINGAGNWFGGQVAGNQQNLENAMRQQQMGMQQQGLQLDRDQFEWQKVRYAAEQGDQYAQQAYKAWITAQQPGMTPEARANLENLYRGFKTKAGQYAAHLPESLGAAVPYSAEDMFNFAYKGSQMAQGGEGAAQLATQGLKNLGITMPQAQPMPSPQNVQGAQSPVVTPFRSMEDVQAGNPASWLSALQPQPAQAQPIPAAQAQAEPENWFGTPYKVEQQRAEMRRKEWKDKWDFYRRANPNLPDDPQVRAAFVMQSGGTEEDARALAMMSSMTTDQAADNTLNEKKFGETVRHNKASEMMQKNMLAFRERQAKEANLDRDADREIKRLNAMNKGAGGGFKVSTSTYALMDKLQSAIDFRQTAIDTGVIPQKDGSEIKLTPTIKKIFEKELASKQSKLDSLQEQVFRSENPQAAIESGMGATGGAKLKTGFSPKRQREIANMAREALRNGTLPSRTTFIDKVANYAKSTFKQRWDPVEIGKIYDFIKQHGG